MSLSPSSNCGGSSSQDRGAARRLDSHGDVAESQILNDETVGRGGRLVCGEAGLDSNGRAGDGAVENRDGLGGRHVEADAAVVDGDALVDPLPVEAADDGGAAVVEDQVAHRVLLVADGSTD